MKTRIGVWMSSLAFCLAAITVQADPILVEDWTGTTIEQAAEISGNPLDNLGSWYAFINNTPRWGLDTDSCDDPCDGTYARHLVPASGDTTNSLYYGIAGTFEAGMTINLSFDYVSSNRGGFIGLLGLTDGVTSLDPFAPFWYNGDSTDGEQLLADGTLAMTSEWMNMAQSTTLTSNYDAIAFIVVMGGADGLRGIDNINISTMPVPEPATLALFGLGLAGIGFSRRKKA